MFGMISILMALVILAVVVVVIRVIPGLPAPIPGLAIAIACVIWLTWLLNFMGWIADTGLRHGAWLR